MVEVWQEAKEREVERTRPFFSGVRVIPLDGDLAEEAGRLACRLRAAGFTVGLADAVVAASAMRISAPVLTTNPRHFMCVPGLKTWYLKDMLEVPAERRENP